MASDGYKLPPPKAFTGKYEDWDDFSYKFKSYMTMKNLRYQAFFQLAEHELVPITNENFKNPKSDDYDEVNIQLSHELQYALINVCEGSALSVIKQSDSPHGIEAWRRLH